MGCASACEAAGTTADSSGDRGQPVAVRAGTAVEIGDVHPEGTGLVEHDNIFDPRARRRHVRALRAHRAEVRWSLLATRWRGASRWR